MHVLNFFVSRPKVHQIMSSDAGEIVVSSIFLMVDIMFCSVNVSNVIDPPTSWCVICRSRVLTMTCL